MLLILTLVVLILNWITLVYTGIPVNPILYYFTGLYCCTVFPLLVITLLLWLHIYIKMHLWLYGLTSDSYIMRDMQITPTLSSLVWYDTGDMYQRVRRIAVLKVAEAKTQVREEFGEAMEQDFLLASKRFW